MTQVAGGRGRHVALRRCVACRAARPKGELLRVVRGPGGDIALDPLGRGAGRGAYVCRSAKCAGLALRRKAIERALGKPLPQGVAQEILQAAGAENPSGGGGGNRSGASGVEGETAAAAAVRA